MAECLLAVSVQWMRFGQRAAESRSWRDERNVGANVVAASLDGGIDIVRAALARAERHTDVRGLLEVSSFTFMHSNQQRCGEIGRFS